jgi:hypothetical protein
MSEVIPGTQYLFLPIEYCVPGIVLVDSPVSCDRIYRNPKMEEKE